MRHLTSTNQAPRQATLHLPGRPVVWQRVRRGNGQTYVPAATVKAEEAIGWSWRAQGWRGSPRGDVDIAMALKFIFADGRQRGDVDNLCKTVLDGLNKLAYADDAQVVDLHAVIIRGPQAGTVLAIEERVCG